MRSPAHLMHAAVPVLALVPVRGLLSVQANGVGQSLTIAAVIFGMQGSKNAPLSGIYAEIKRILSLVRAVRLCGNTKHLKNGRFCPQNSAQWYLCGVSYPCNDYILL